MANNSIWTDNIQNNAITNDKILNNTINESKIISLPFTKITGNINASTQILDNTINESKLQNIKYTKLYNDVLFDGDKILYFDFGNNIKLWYIAQIMAESWSQFNRVFFNQIDFDSIYYFDGNNFILDDQYFSSSTDRIFYRNALGKMSINKIFTNLFNTNTINASILLDNTILGNKI